MDTKEKLLDAAERLFSDKGFSATSVRAITAEAGVNLASLHYHYGSKESLIQAVFERRLGPLNQERLILLENIEGKAEPEPPALESILEAYLAPPLRLIHDPQKGGQRFMRLMGRAFSEPGDLFESKIAPLFSKIFSRYHCAFQRALPQVSPEDLFWRMHFLIGAMSHLLVHATRVSTGSALTKQYQEILPGLDCKRLGVDGLLERLIPFAVAGLKAPHLAVKSDD